MDNISMHHNITTWQAIRLLLKHRRLDDRRSLSSEENRFAKVFTAIATGFVIIYLMGIAIALSLAINGDRSTTSTEFFTVIMPFILVIDFNIRFSIQQTPAHVVKPYLLLPLSRHLCVDTFIFSSLISLGNFIWLAFVLPYVLMSVIFSYGWLTALMLVLLFQILVLTSSQLYSITHALIARSFLWWILPVTGVALIASPLYIGTDAGWSQFERIYSFVGELLNRHNPLPLLLAAIVLAISILVNRKIQSAGIDYELMRSEKKGRIGKVRKFAFLDKYGEIGMFMQLEIKLLLRNKNPRKAILNGVFTMILICAIIVASDVYDSTGMTNFWALYNFILFGSMTLMGLMSYEGNYIDCFLTRRENILELLKAKYVFYSAILILPFLLMLPTVISGKWSLYMLISYAIFTMGFQYFVIFHTAIFNKITMPLNTKLIAKGGIKTNYIALMILAIVFILPNIIVSTLQSFFSDNIAYTIMLIIGSAFVATHNIWLRHIYNRLMKRKYINLEGFIATR